MEDLINVEECTSISELIKENEIKAKEINVDVKFDSLYERVLDEAKTKANRTAVITPVVRKKHIVDYESSESDEDNLPEGIGTPHPEAAGKTPRLKRQRVATPHVKKLLSLMRQKVVEEYEETLDDGNVDGSPVTKTTPSRNENETGMFTFLIFNFSFRLTAEYMSHGFIIHGFNDYHNRLLFSITDLTTDPSKYNVYYNI